MTEIKLRRGDDVGKALRRLKKALGRERLFDELKKRRHFQKPSDYLRKKQKEARFNAMLRQRHADQ
ncbi:MAG: 30S ribosomal protein S21 [Verrucomicrobia bacterium]|nr:30S ribosomal protein S21 [Verrucomicrobiota bacterium]